MCVKCKLTIIIKKEKKIKMPYEKTYINGRNSLHYDLKTINTSRNIHWFDNKTIIILVHNKHSDSCMHSGM